jgi:hypothetical protein
VGERRAALGRGAGLDTVGVEPGALADDAGAASLDRLEALRDRLLVGR